MKKKAEFKPQNTIHFVDSDKSTTLSFEKISISLVGEKAYGLTCLPKAWTLPFIVLSKDLLENYRALKDDEKFSTYYQEIWKANVETGLNLNLDTNSPLIIRSSSTEEGLDERGKLHSTSSSIQALITDLLSLIKKLSEDHELDGLSIPLIIQNYIPEEKDKGHLSNERRLYKDTRDWIGETEGSKLEDRVFKIILRNWREKIDLQSYTKKSLECSSRFNIKNTLKIAAQWAYNIQHLRIHFEWVFDGHNIYIVQADEAKNNNGINPHKVYEHLKKPKNIDFIPSVLKEITSQHAKVYPKIHNVFVYQKLKFPIAKLYILEDKEYINKLKINEVPSGLESDLTSLFQSNFIIRMDVNTEAQNFRQMLPRTDVDNPTEALKWLKEECRNLSNLEEHNFVFIFHGFIPAIASAFAYAAPQERKVQIESLWGLPEGLYYNSHDKYIVDTGSKDIGALNPKKFSVHTKPRYKGFCVIPTDNGEWNAEKVKQPHDWKVSIEKEEWITKIAKDSRLIAEHEKKALSVMWLIDVQGTFSHTEIFPWHHEEYDIHLLSKTIQNRKKTPFDEVFLLRNKKDINKLEQESARKSQSIQFVKIQLTDSTLLRDKKILAKIGEIAKKINATVILEGGVLSHAFYQLMQTGASIEPLLPFDEENDTLVFNKLVRDKVPHNIEEGGESAQIVRISKKSKLIALKEKLIEEAFEVKDADDDEVLSELADVKEIIDQILFELGLSKDDLNENQNAKRKNAGGFSEGYVLLETQNLTPEHKVDATEENQLFEINDFEKLIPEIDYKQINNKKITRYEDERKQGESKERILRVDSPVTRKEWNIESKGIILPSYPDEKFIVSINSLREGTNNRIELSISTQTLVQLDLDLFDED